MQQRRQDDPDQPNNVQQEPYVPTRSRSDGRPQWGAVHQQPQWTPPPEQAPQYGDQPPYFGQPGGPGGRQAVGWQAPPPGRAPKGKKNNKLGYGCLSVVGLIVIVVIAVAVGGNSGGTANAGSNTPAAATTTQAAAGDGGTAGAAPPATAQAVAAKTQAPAAPDQVVFSCNGSAPDGVDITYGAEGSNDSASHLPFHQTVSLSSTVQYYDITAQLQGAGHVSCTTVVHSDGQSVVQAAQASGGYNIASAEVCSSFDGSWDAC